MSTGFTDIHCHGGGGFSFSDPNPENIARAIAAHKAHGTTTLVASLVTEPLEKIRDQIARLIPFVDSGDLAGIHLEGPYLSHVQCGAHDSQLLRMPNPDEIAELIEVGEGHIRMITIAPELPGAIESIRMMVSRDVVAALGHSNATFEEAQAGIKAGATVVTHMFNGLPELNHRTATITNALLIDWEIHLEVILDGVHVNKSAMQLLLNLAHDRIILITDAMSAAGGPEGKYKIGDLDVNVANGIATLARDGTLAGSTLTMDKAFARLMSDHGLTHDEAMHNASHLAKRVLKL
jgi:N-acetylglucosamine-6-phosphate deacetylase